jgi:1-acyl-sn-glycerol-3-phosphate acyltransferase
MLEQLGQSVKEGLKEWTRSLAGDKVTNLDSIARPKTEYGVDPFGFEVDFALAAMAPFLWLYKHYFRVETHGIENVPRGRVLLVGNHSGQLPWDAAMVAVALFTEAHPPRAVRSMTEKWAASLPYVSAIFARAGQIVGTPENCRRLLMAEEAVLVFPEGVRGIAKLWPQRYQLQEFGLGFMRLALETSTPIVPLAVIGAEEQAPAIADLKSVGRLIGFPAFPITLTGLPFPLPTKYRIYFGKPLTFTGSPDDEDAELDKKVRVVRSAIESQIEQGLRERKHVFW